MEEFDNAIDPDNDISYGISSKGHEVMIVNEREIFVKRKIGKRTLDNNYSIGWSYKNQPSCTDILTYLTDNYINNIGLLTSEASCYSSLEKPLLCMEY